MDIIQLVFGFVNAPLFATFLLGMFWARTTGTGRVPRPVRRHRHLGPLPRADHRRRQRARASRAATSAWCRPSPAKWRRTSGWPASPSSSASSLTLVHLAGHHAAPRPTRNSRAWSIRSRPKIKDEEHGLVSAPGRARHRPADRLRHPQHHLLVNERNTFMGLDIRWPIGLMFSLIGLLLTIYGFATSGDAEMYQRSLDININLHLGHRPARLRRASCSSWPCARRPTRARPGRSNLTVCCRRVRLTGRHVRHSTYRHESHRRQVSASASCLPAGPWICSR